MKQPNSSRQREAQFRRERRKAKFNAAAPPGSDGKPLPDAKPATPDDKQKRRKYLREYVRWLWPHRWALLVVFVLALISASLDLVWPLAIKRIVDGVLLSDAIDNAEKLRRLNVFGQECVLACDDGKEQRLRATAVPLPDAVLQAHDLLGLTVEQLTPLRAERLGLGADDGLLITNVQGNSPAARAGLRPGDVIVQLGRYRVSTLDDFAALLARLPDAGRSRVFVVREGQVGYTLLEW